MVAAVKKLSGTVHTDRETERMRQEIKAAIDEIQSSPLVFARVIPGVTLEDGVATPVAHGLKRPATWVAPSCPRGPSTSGRIEEIRDGTNDRNMYVTLKASGWGATITVDVAVA